MKKKNVILAFIKYELFDKERNIFKFKNNLI